MFQLVESLKVKDRQLANVFYHNQRINNARSVLLNAQEEWDLSELILIPIDISNNIYKCRVIYSNKINKIEFTPYKVRDVKRLFLVNGDEVDYTYKYLNRENIDILKKNLTNPENEDVLIVKDGFITDTSYSNIVFYDGQEWITPSTTLLNGTKRQFYIDRNIIKTAEIRVNDLIHFSKARIINAMIDLEDKIEISIKNIITNNN